MSARPTPKPWPMKWIAVSILVFITLYTFLTLHFRKPGKAYQPYQDSRDHATVSRLVSAGYQRIPASIDRPADAKSNQLSLGSTHKAEIKEVAGGLPTELATTLIDQPVLPDSFSQINAPAEANTAFPYSVEFTCLLPDNKRLLSETYVYRKEQELVVVAGFEHLGGDLLARTKDVLVLLTVPAGTLQPGTYSVTLAGSRHSKQWTLQVH